MSDLTLKKKEAKAKKMMLLFALLSITMTFGGLTSAYVVSKGRPDWLVDFTLPVSFTYSTILLVISSITIHFAKFFVAKPNGKSKSLNFLWLTFALGISFLFFQLASNLLCFVGILGIFFEEHTLLFFQVLCFCLH